MQNTGKNRLGANELAGELLALRIDARERLADPLLLLGDIEPVKSPAEPMVCGLSPGGRRIQTSGPSRDRWLTELVEPHAETTWRARTGFHR